MSVDAVPSGAGLSPAVLRQAFSYFPSGVTAVGAMVDGEPAGMAASSFTSVSLSPPLVSVCVAHSSTTWPRLKVARRVGISVLAEHHGPAARALSGKSDNRFAEIDWVATPDGAVLVHGATLWLDCSVYRQVEAGDHDVVLLEIHHLESYPDVAPMVFHGSAFRTLVPPRG